MLQVRQRADDVRKSLDLLQLLNDGAEICNMMEGYFDFQQFQVCMYHLKKTAYFIDCVEGILARHPDSLPPSVYWMRKSRGNSLYCKCALFCALIL